MSTGLSQTQREELRFAVREQLVAASSVALNGDMLLRRVNRSRSLDFAPSHDDVTTAATFLVDLGQAKAAPEPLGSTLYYQATAVGVLAHERGQ